MNSESFDDILSSVIGNEELMGRISKIVNDHKGEGENAALSDVIAEISSSLQKDEKADTPSVKTEKHNPFSSSNQALLCALKPFMSEKRRGMIDNILKIQQMSEIMKLVK
ncbi:MAG: hypothetical protein J6B60_01125 [Clostridia bacterium]|nr:hypothetical protein [Clostridia bacterium]